MSGDVFSCVATSGVIHTTYISGLDGWECHVSEMERLCSTGILHWTLPPETKRSRRVKQTLDSNGVS